MSEEPKVLNVDKKTHAERIAICKTCPERRGRMLMTSTCGVCGCLVAAKALLQVWHCPLKKW